MSHEAISWADALAHAVAAFDADDSSENHARLRVSVATADRNPPPPETAAATPSSTQPVMVWRGVSSVDTEREVIHIASPIAPEDACDAVALAGEADDLPIGALRTLGGLVHVHETLRLTGLTLNVLDAVIRLIARESAQLAQETASSSSTELGAAAVNERLEH